MRAKFKKYFLFSLLFLPFGAFADISSSLSFLAPPQNDFSMSLLNRIFGSSGNVLHGAGNQLVGTLMGVFNTFWIIALGLGVMYMVWDSVMSAAQSGEMMSGRQKKTVFRIIGIVIAFCACVPSSSSGYSLAQNSVIWLMSQGVGLADRVYGKLHSYLMAGGMTFTVKPTAPLEMTPILPSVANMLKAQVCMYKLESILTADKKAQEDAIKTDPSLPKPPSTPYEGERMGYSINQDNTITVGSFNDKYNADNPGSHKYNAECGTISWSIPADVMKRISREYSQEIENGDDKLKFGFESSLMNPEDYKAIMSLQEQALTEMFFNLQPVAQAISTVNTKDAAAKEREYANLSNSGAVAMASSGMSYATILDPLRNKSIYSRNDGVSKRMQRLRGQGWMFTPLAVVLPGVTQAQVMSVAESYPPAVTAANMTQLTGGIFDSLNDKSRAELAESMSRVDKDEYVTKASAILAQINPQTQWTNIDFNKILDDYTTGKRDLDSLIGTIDFMFGSAPTLLLQGIQKGAELGLDITHGFLNGINELIKTACDAATVGTGSCHGPLNGILGSIKDSKNGLGTGIDRAIDGVNEFKNSLKGEVEWSKKGGMNQALYDLTMRAGPMGPMAAMVVTNMIGKGVGKLQENLFKIDNETNAFNGAIALGGTMMYSAMHAFFQFQAFGIQSDIVKSILDGVGAGGIPIIGDVLSGAINIGGSMLGGAISSKMGGVAEMMKGGVNQFVGYYITFIAIFFIGGTMLYLLLPLTFIFAFAASSFRWLGMVFINVLAAPIFCFNMLRAEGEGLIGHRSERFLTDVVRTLLTPTILTIGAVAFIILFNIAFMLLSSLYGELLPIILEIYKSDVLMAATLGTSLIVYAMIILWLGQLLSSLTTTEFVTGVGHAIGEGIQHMADHSPAQQIQQGVSGTASNIVGTAKQVAGPKQEGAAPKQPQNQAP